MNDVTIVSSAQEAVIRTNEIMRDSCFCVWRSQELVSYITSLSKANLKSNILQISDYSYP
jgi:hypothetical protein